MIIPTPKKYTVNKDITFQVKGRVCTACESWQGAVEVLQDAFYKIFGFQLTEEKGGIELYYDENIKAGAYALKAEDGIHVKASDYEGVMYGIASVLQIIKVKDYVITSPQIHIEEDYAEKDHRKLGVDVARQWHSFDKLLKFVDLCFLYKIKYLGIHFIDDQMYTLPSKAFPKLPTKGKSYTFEQIAYLNQYAELRNVSIIAGVEGPGHARHMVKTYPEIFGNKYDVDLSKVKFEQLGGWECDPTCLMCAGSEVTWNAMKMIIKEVSDMFPNSQYMGMGGDEACKELWNCCSECRKYMEEHGIEDLDGLYEDFMSRSTRYALECGKTPIISEEKFLLKGKEIVPKETVISCWESYYALAPDILKQGYRVINNSWKPLYIVQHPTKLRWDAFEVMKWNVYNWQHFWPEVPAYLNPIHVQPTDQVLGGGISAWELTYEQEINHIMEKLAAVSERTWTVERVIDDEEFLCAMYYLVGIAARLINY